MNKKVRRWHFTIRKKLLLVTLTLLIIPFIGYRYINEMESYLRSELEEELLNRVRVVAAVLHDRAGIFSARTSTSTPVTNINQHIYVRPLSSAIQLDGYDDEWDVYAERTLTFTHENDLLKNNAHHSMQFSLQIGHYRNYLYCLIKVTDDRIIYRQPNSLRLDHNDHILIGMENSKGEYVRYAIATQSPGWVSAQQLDADYASGRASAPEYRIKGEWQQTESGYNVEFRIPLDLVGNKIAFALADVDDVTTYNLNALLATADISDLSTLGTIVIPSPEVETLLDRLKRKASRTWVLDNNYRVIALTGNLKDSREPELYEQALTTKKNTDRSFLSGILHLFYQLILQQPSTSFSDDLSAASRLDTPEVNKALAGQPATGWRQSPDKRANIITATHPIYNGKQVVGVIAIEETTNNILLMQNQAMEILINLSMLTFAIATIVLLGFASRLSYRVKKLRDSAEAAISHDGKVQGDIPVTQSLDEIGDLNRSIADMLNRLRQYNRYLETMASKLAHELRTPITVVRSSLDNLQQTDVQQSATYLARAQEGIARLNNILTRMSEATRLEQTLQSESRRDFNLLDVITGCIEGYRLANRQANFSLHINGDHKQYMLNGSPDLIAQLFDKLVNNAISFHKADTAIETELSCNTSQLVLSVSNQGPVLPQHMQQQLFDSMVSVRDKQDDQPHLGLGLYIVRLISEFHHGKVRAFNRNDNSGVTFEICLPKLSA